MGDFVSYPHQKAKGLPNQRSLNGLYVSRTRGLDVCVPLYPSVIDVVLCLVGKKLRKDIYYRRQYSFMQSFKHTYSMCQCLG